MIVGSDPGEVVGMIGVMGELGVIAVGEVEGDGVVVTDVVETIGVDEAVVDAAGVDGTSVDGA